MKTAMLCLSGVVVNQILKEAMLKLKKKYSNLKWNLLF